MKPELIFILCLFITSGLTANILFVDPLASPSHYLWNKVLSFELLKNGHNITMLTHDREKGPTPQNFTVITMEGFYEALEANFDMEAFIQETSILKNIKTMYDYIEMSCQFDMNTKGLEALLTYPKDYKFDLVIYDITSGLCLLPLIERFHNPPVMAVTAFPLPPVQSNSFGNHVYTSYMPYFSTKFTNKMSFKERIANFLYICFDIFYRNYISARKQFEMAKKRFGENILPFDQMERSISLLLTNTDPVLDYPLPLPPNIIPVGGLQVKPAKTLPQDLKKIADNAKNGLILFSLGTNVRSDKLKPDVRKAFLDVFAKLSQTVVWKFETDNLEGLPPNVIIRKWLPQNDILGHPNTKLFISHGGGLSTQEAMYHGVPLVGIPFVVDQHANVGKMQRRQLATFVDHRNLTFDTLYAAVTEVLNNPIYSKNIKEISKRYRDQPQTALQRAVFWTEYILRHGSANHLVLPARDMPVYQTSNLDVIAVLVLGISAVTLLLLLIIKRFCLLMSRSRTNTKQKTS